MWQEQGTGVAHPHYLIGPPTPLAPPLVYSPFSFFYKYLICTNTAVWSVLLIHAHSHQGSKRKQGSFFVGLLSLIIEEGGQRVHAFNTICKCSTRPKLTLVPLDLSSTFLGMRWYREMLWPSWRIYFNSSLSGTHATHTHCAIMPLSTYGEWHKEQFPKILISMGQRFHHKKGYKWKMATANLSGPRIFLQRNL